MKYLLTLLSLLFASSIAQADCVAQCPVTPDNVGAYFAGDHFQWTDYNDTVHLLAGFSSSVIVAELLIHYADLKPWQAAIIGSVTAGLIGTTKEVMFDTYTSRTDIKTWWAGGIAGGLTLMTWHF